MKDEELHQLKLENIGLRGKLQALEEKNEKCGPGNHAQCVLELEQLKTSQFEEMKRLSDQLERERAASDLEKAKVR